MVLFDETLRYVCCITNFESFSRPLERKFSEQNIGAPPSYEEAVSESGNTVPSQRY